MAENTINAGQFPTVPFALTDYLIKTLPDGTLQKDTVQKLSNFLSISGVLAFRGVLLSTDATVTEDGIYVAGDSGTYTNNGGLIVDVSDQIVLISVTGTQTVFEQAIFPISLTLDATPTIGSTNTVESGGVADELNKKVDKSKERSKNLFNYNSDNITEGKYISVLGVETNNALYVISDFIEVDEGDILTKSDDFSNTVYSLFYNSNKDAIVDSESNLQTITAPATSKYVKVTVGVSNLQNYQLEFGSTETDYEPFTQLKNLIVRESIKDGSVTFDKIANEAVGGVNIKDNAITSGKIVNNSIELKKLKDSVLGLNKFNPNDDDFVEDFYLFSDGLPTVSNTLYVTTGFIDVSGLVSDKIFADADSEANLFRFYAFYDIDKNFISGSWAQNGVGSSGVSRFTDSVYMRVSFRKVDVDSYILFFSDVYYKPTYEPYKGYLIPESKISLSPQYNSYQLDSILGKEGITINQSSLSSSGIIETTDFPYHLKKGLSMSIYADLTLLGSVSYGKGYGAYRGEYITIDNTNVYYYFDSVLQETTAHGLTISTFLKSSFYVDDNGLSTVIVQSLGGYFETTFQFEFRMNYEAFIRTDGQVLSNVKLSCVSKDFRNPVWAFGDSYFGVDNDRWVGIMKDFGYFNFMINGLAGQVSSGAYDDLLRSLNYGTPKYLLWCLGMNDTNTSYQNTLDLLIEKCNILGINLILATIPTVPTRDKETIKTIVESSGYRYIDFYKAVGTDSDGVWYSGYLSVDGVHPTTLGAESLATQVLTDFPELMQYGKNN